jgi:apolipoprotein D and lipocalin family protein
VDPVDGKAGFRAMRLNPGVTGWHWLAAFLLLAGCTHVPEGVEPVRGFDVARYMGTWYEVAHLPNRFEKGLDRVTATYSLQDDGTVKVVNRGYDVAAGEWRDIVGTAKFVGAKDVAALKVSFFGPFYGGYNIVDLDADYRHALVVGPDRSFLWILSREPAPPADVIERLERKAAALGFDTRALVYVQHSG